jgi:SAM-dependent methyltransferase
MNCLRKTAVISAAVLILICFCSRNFNRSQSIAQENSHSKSLAPFVPTPMKVVEEMLELADVKENDVVYDIGCGDGRIMVMAAEKYGARGVGVDYDPERIAEAKDRVKRKGVENLVQIVHQDALTVDLSPATVVTLYLTTSGKEIIRPNFEIYIKPGSRVVSHNYDISGWEVRKKVSVYEDYDYDYQEHTLYLWIIGEHKPKPKKDSSPKFRDGILATKQK